MIRATYDLTNAMLRSHIIGQSKRHRQRSATTLHYGHTENRQLLESTLFSPDAMQSTTVHHLASPMTQCLRNFFSEGSWEIYWAEYHQSINWIWWMDDEKMELCLLLMRVFLLAIEFSRVRGALEPSRKNSRITEQLSKMRGLSKIFKKLWKIFDSSTEEQRQW